MQFYWLTLGILAVWRVTHFLNAEDGPADIGVRLRRLAGSSWLGRMLDCFYCLSFWVAAPIALWIGQGLKERALLCFAMSAGAILLERLTTRHEPFPPAPYFEGDDDGLLREPTQSLAR